MSETHPPRRLAFSTQQDAETDGYTPAKTRDPELAQLYKGERRGIVIAQQQKIGVEAMRVVLDSISEIDDETREDITDIFSTTSLGSAYYLYAYPYRNSQMNRMVTLPDLIHRETGERMTRDGLMSKIQKNLASTAGIATNVHNMVKNGQTGTRLEEGKTNLGKQLAIAGVDFGVLRDDVTRGTLGEYQMQFQARESAMLSQQRANDLTKLLGTRPTLAQLPDAHSPLMDYLHTDKTSISESAFDVLQGAISDARNAALGK